MAILSFGLKSAFKFSKLGTFLRKYRWNKAITNTERINRVISDYMGDISKEQRDELVKDILYMARGYRFSADEYFYYHFKDKPLEERLEFISDLNRIDYCESLNLAKNQAIFDSKLKSAEVFGKYYGREICAVEGAGDLDAFVRFVETHDKFIVKPLFGTCGRGIKIIDQKPDNAQQLNKMISDLISEYCSGAKDGLIAEELLVQVDELAQFNPSSLNTIRISTIKYDDSVEIIAAFFRAGRKGSVVDNVGAGGVFGTIDLESGKIDAVADEYGEFYEKHPDSEIQMIGFEIPMWEDAVKLAKELACVVKGNRYAGWDLALTENGWAMIEGNARGQFVWQIPRQKGFLKEANQILKRLGRAEIKKLSI